MRFELLGQDRLDRAAWEELVGGSTGGTIYHTAEWAGLWPAAFPHFKAIFAVGIENGRYQAGMPLVARGRYPLSRAYSMPMGTYGGILVGRSLAGRAGDYVGGLIGCVGRLAPCLLEVADFEGRQDFWGRLGFVRREARTHLADLKVLGSLSKQKTKRGAVQSAGRGVSVRELANEAELDDCRRLLEARDLGYGQSAKYPPGFLKLLWRRLGPLGRARIALAVHDSKTVGFCAALAFGDTVTYWDGASGPGFRRLRPADALIQSTVDWGLRLGCRWLNLGGSPPGADGLVRFKESWGGVERLYAVYTRQAWWFKAMRGLRR